MPWFPSPEAAAAWAACPDFVDVETEQSVTPHPRHLCGVDVLEAGVCDYCGQTTEGESDDNV